MTLCFAHSCSMVAKPLDSTLPYSAVSNLFTNSCSLTHLATCHIFPADRNSRPFYVATIVYNVQLFLN